MSFLVRPLVGSLVLGLAALVGCSSSTPYAATPMSPIAVMPALAVTALPNPPSLRAIAAAPGEVWSHTFAKPSAPTAQSPSQLSYVAGAAPLPPAPRAVARIDQPIRASTANRDMRVMTFNLRVATVFDGTNTWGLRKGTVIERVRDFDPDMLGTQEGLTSQTSFLQQELPDYSFFGAGRNDGKRSGEMCGVFFKSSKFEKIDGGHFWLSMTPQVPGSKAWGAPFPRMVTWVKLRPRDGGQTFFWFNTHFEAFSERARTESARLLQQRMISIAGASPSLVTGDFNADADSVPHRMLCSPAKSYAPRLIDAFRAANRAGRDQGTRHGFHGGKGGDRIDWILISPAFQAVSAAIDHGRGVLGYPSDHFPVMVTIRAVASPSLPMARLE